MGETGRAGERRRGGSLLFVTRESGVEKRSVYLQGRTAMMTRRESDLCVEGLADRWCEGRRRSEG